MGERKIINECNTYILNVMSPQRLTTLINMYDNIKNMNDDKLKKLVLDMEDQFDDNIEILRKTLGASSLAKRTETELNHCTLENVTPSKKTSRPLNIRPLNNNIEVKLKALMESSPSEEDEKIKYYLKKSNPVPNNKALDELAKLIIRKVGLENNILNMMGGNITPLKGLGFPKSLEQKLNSEAKLEGTHPDMYKYNLLQAREIIRSYLIKE
jgi:hypothetical protein